jgi:hypothetical protein
VINYKLIVISDSRVELRCSRCNGLVGLWDEPLRAKKLISSEQAWSEEERQSMR